MIDGHALYSVLVDPQEFETTVFDGQIKKLLARFIGKPKWEGLALDVFVRLLHNQDAKLKTKLAEIYNEISSDPVFDNLPSAVPYFLGGRDVKSGHGYIFIPAGVHEGEEDLDEKHPIVWMHGYGGNLLWNIFIARQIFPDRVIIFPSGGEYWADQPTKPVQLFFNSLMREVEVSYPDQGSLLRPWVVPISQSGPLAFQLVAEHPGCFEGLIAITTAPKKNSPFKLPKDYPVLSILAKDDERFERKVAIKATGDVCKVAQLSIEVLPGGHYIAAYSTKEIKRCVQEFLNQRD